MIKKLWNKLSPETQESIVFESVVMMAFFKMCLVAYAIIFGGDIL